MDNTKKQIFIQKVVAEHNSGLQYLTETDDWLAGLPAGMTKEQFIAPIIEKHESLIRFLTTTNNWVTGL